MPRAAHRRACAARDHGSPRGWREVIVRLRQRRMTVVTRSATLSRSAEWIAIRARSNVLGWVMLSGGVVCDLAREFVLSGPD